MKAKVTIGSMVAELEGEPSEIYQVLARGADRQSAVVKFELGETTVKKRKAVRAKRKAKVGHGKSHLPWTPPQVTKLIAEHRSKTLEELAKMTGHSLGSVKQKLIKLRNEDEIE